MDRDDSLTYSNDSFNSYNSLGYVSDNSVFNCTMNELNNTQKTGLINKVKNTIIKKFTILKNIIKNSDDYSLLKIMSSVS